MDIEFPPASVRYILPLERISPLTSNAYAGLDVPTPTKPLLLIRKAVEVAEAVEVEIVKSGEVLDETADRESKPQGVVVPIPNRPLLETTAKT
jgi:hypothetical protein